MWKKKKQEEWPEVIDAPEIGSSPRGIMSSEDIITLFSDEVEEQDRYIARLHRKLFFWREWAMIATGAVIVFLGWLLIMLLIAW